MGIGSFLIFRVIPIVVMFLALFIGWLSRHDSPEGVLFATVVPLMKGYVPPTIIGHGYMKGTPDVPFDMVPQGRPKNELFLTLPGNHKMPQNGLGMCCRPSAYDDELVRRTVLWYLLRGGRHIDTAQVYLNHRAIGKGIQEAIERGVPRKEIFVTTKVFPSNFGRNATREDVQKSLNDLGLEYIDLVLMHAPRGFSFMRSECAKLNLSHKECRSETWKTLSEFRKEGILKNVGVSNFFMDQIEDLQSLNLAPVAVHQMQYNPWAPDHAVETVSYCQKNSIAVTAYSSLGGLIQNSLTLTVETLNEVAKTYNKSVAQIMLRWAIQKDIAIIPGTGNPKHMVENLEVYSFKLSKDDMTKLDGLRSDEKAKEFFYYSMPSDDFW